MVAGHLQEKSGQFYAVLSYKDTKGKRRTKWVPTGLMVRGNKKRAEAMLSEIRRKFVPPEQEDDDEIPLDVNISFVHYLDRWLKIAKTTIKPATYTSYSQMIRSPIRPYFEEKGLTLIGVQASDIQEFYLQQLDRVSANTVIHYHALLHKALKYAVKTDLIPVNPVSGTGFQAGHAAKFQKLLEQEGINATVRRTLGEDIKAACGQLRRDTIENN